MADTSGAAQFADAVFPEELNVLRARREALRAVAKSTDLPVATIPEHKGPPSVALRLAGLALSGGGIRAATFSLGVLQGLDRAGLLPQFDYLSTVSGGGYIGACLSALTRRPRSTFPFATDGLDEDDPALRRLRNTTPRFVAPDGLLDFLAIPIVMVRGAFGNLLKLFPYAAIFAFFEFFFLLHHAQWSHALIRPHVEIADWAGHCSDIEWHSYLFFSEILAVFAVLWILFGRFPGSPVDRGLVRRRLRDRSFSVVIAVTLGVAFLEMQPAVLCAFDSTPIHHNLRHHGTLTSLGHHTVAVVGIAAAFALAAMLTRSRSFLRPLALGVSFLLGIGLTYLVMLYLAHWLAFAELHHEDWRSVVLYGSSLSLFLLVLSRVAVDANNSSMFGFYRDRLAATFMLQPHPDGGLAITDDLTLAELCEEGSTTPYHIFNATLNLQGSNDRALRGRRAAPFFFSKLYVGSDRTGYCKSHDLGRVLPKINVGTAMAISAAAASPNMGTYTIAPMVMLMTLLNVRMGFWMPNPREFRRWMNEAWLPKHLDDGGIAGFMARKLAAMRWTSGDDYYIRELFSHLDDQSQNINVSDGGHIENTGIYELLRRRCKFIVAVDAEADPLYHFGGLATLLRLARLDLGVEIDIDVKPLDLQRATVRRHAVIGRIRYPGVDTGVLLYIKAGLTGDEDEVIRQYCVEHPQFPQEPTSDQFFSEVQFECYRALGALSVACAESATKHGSTEAWMRAVAQGSVAPPPTVYPPVLP